MCFLKKVRMFHNFLAFIGHPQSSLSKTRHVVVLKFQTINAYLPKWGRIVLAIHLRASQSELAESTIRLCGTY